MFNSWRRRQQEGSDLTPPTGARSSSSAREEFGHLPLNAPGDANGVSSYQPGAKPQEQVREAAQPSANGALHRSTATMHRHPGLDWSVPHVTFIEFNVVPA